MSSQFFLPWSFLSLLYFLSVILVKIQSSLSTPVIIQSCHLPFRCGNIKASFPFWGGERQKYCGHPNLELRCDQKYNTTAMTIGELKYRVLNVDQEEQVVRIARQDYFDGLCPQKNTNIDENLFVLFDGYDTFKLFYDCPVFPGHFTCNLKDITNYMDGFIRTGGNFLPGCNNSVDFPVSKTFLSAAKWNITALKESLEEGFEVTWKVNPCDKKCKSCGYDVYSQEAICYCSDGRISNSTGSCPGSFFSKRRKISLGVAGGVVGMIIIFSVLLVFWKKNTENDSILTFWQKKTKNDQDMEAFIKNYRSLAPKRYCYSDVKKMTKSFNYKLGQGGYGQVYKGKLPDGRHVAVKILKASKGNGEEFINEVAIISRTSHVNIVNFLGFCYEKKKRALIYEYLPNGSLDKYIYDQESSSTDRKLEWRTIYQIVVGIARGLDYLHRGCNVRIVHFDIKPHNILLDKDFCPKISDFGLSKQSDNKESIMSMLNARGTIGYIAPEVFCRSFGGVSHKSDVYSYGMMILEMVGGKNKVDVRASHSSEIYFPNSIYKHLEPGSDFQFDGVVTEAEKEMVKKMIVVSLWSIQTNPSDRPSMTKVVEMLGGSIENLQIPPNPTLFFPRTSDHQSPPASLSTELASLE